MNADEYASQQAVISSAVVRYVMTFGKFFTGPKLGLKEWLNLLGMLYPEIQRRREESAALARDFYDAQRSQHHPDLERHDRLLESSDFKHFVADMQPARAKMSIADSPEHAVSQLALQAVRGVENAGRRQIIHAVEDDQAVADLIAGRTPAPTQSSPPTFKELLQRRQATDPEQPAPAPDRSAPERPTPEPTESPSGEKGLVKGWARIATGRETCAWCLMLVSRGPVYTDAHTAGLNLESDLAADMVGAGEDVSQFMDQWHPGCDCKVVPVYKQDNWAGLAAQKRAEELWIDATKKARKLIDSGQSRTTNLGTETLNALRRHIDSGGISSTEWSALTPAA